MSYTFTTHSAISTNLKPAVCGGRTMHIPDQRKETSVRTNFAPFVRTFAAKSRVLDVACGQGFILQMLKEADIEGVGIEFDYQLVMEARSAGLNVSQAEMFQYLHSTEEMFNGCIASHIVEHFTPPKVLELLQLMSRVVHEGGKLIIITPNIADLRRAVGDFWRDPTHVRPYPIEALDKLLTRSGWKKIASRYHSDKRFSLPRTIVHSIRNMLIGHYWRGEDLYVVARKE